MQGVATPSDDSSEDKGPFVEFKLPESWTNIQDKNLIDKKDIVQFWCFFTVKEHNDKSVSLNFLYYLPKYKQMVDLLTN